MRARQRHIACLEMVASAAHLARHCAKIGNVRRASLTTKCFMYGAALSVGAFIIQPANVAYAQPAKLDMVWQSVAVTGSNPAGPPATCAKAVEAFLKSKGFTTAVSKSSEDKDPKYITGGSDAVAV